MRRHSDLRTSDASMQGSWATTPTHNKRKNEDDDMEICGAKRSRSTPTGLTPIMRGADLRSPVAASPSQRSVLDVLRSPPPRAPAAQQQQERAAVARVSGAGICRHARPLMRPNPRRPATAQCGACSKTAPCVGCGYCERATCAACARSCEGCGRTFCGTCTTTDYTARYERVFCLVCNEQVAAAARAGDYAMDVR